MARVRRPNWRHCIRRKWTQEKTVDTDEQWTQRAQRTSGHKGPVFVPTVPPCPQFLPEMTSVHFLLLQWRQSGRTRVMSLKFSVVKVMFMQRPSLYKCSWACALAELYQMQTSPRSCDMPASIIAFLIYRFQCQIYLFHVSNFLKIKFSSPQRASLLERFRLSRKTDYKGRYLKQNL